MSPRLRPGVVVVRRDDRHLQLGLESPHRLVLPDVPEIRNLLDTLQHGRAVPSLGPREADALARIGAAGLLVPESPETEPVLGPTSAPVVLTGPGALVAVAATTLRRVGVTPARRGDVHVLLAHNAVPRETTDALVRDGIPHLLAVALPWGWELGPFVVPGATACLRCIDAAHIDLDPRYGVIVDQIARTSAPFATDPALDAIALGWLGRDLLAHARGRKPTTWSTSIVLTDEGRDAGSATAPFVEERQWLRHPHCGCAWDALTG